jgi:hypothetical protein
MLRSVAMRHRLHDRRSANRPSNGDTTLCPRCGIGLIEFNERYRVQLATGKTVAIPAWICDRPECRYEHAARSGSARAPLQRSPAEPRGRSSRSLMKARAVLRRARRTLSKTLARRKH